MVRRVILVASAVAAVLLGLEKVGIFPLIPPGDVKFTHVVERRPDGRAIASLYSDSGDLTGLLRLVVHANALDPADIQAATASGEPLVVAVEASDGARHTITISKGPDAATREHFLWRSGLPITLAGGTGAFEIQDWVVYSSKQTSDSRSKSVWRTRWTWASWALLALALIGAGLTALPRGQARPATGRALVEAIVASVIGSNAEQTAQLRAFLRQTLLEGISVSEALDALKVASVPGWIRPQFVARARHVFLGRVTAVKAELDTFVGRLA